MLCPRYRAVQCILVFQLPAVGGLVGHLDLDGDGGLATLAEGDLFVVTLDGLAGGFVSRLAHRD